MPSLYNAGQLATIIIKANEKDIEDLGDTNSQKSYIYQFMNIAMWKLAKLADRVEFSDSMTLSSDGFVSFTKSGSPITNMFEPKTVYMPDGQSLQKRTSWESPIGWWRESELQDVHIRGFSLTTTAKLTAGTYQLKYIRYPRPVTIDSDVVDFPPMGYDALIKEVSALIKLPKNSYNGADFMDSKAKQQYNNVAQAAISSKGTGSTGQPLGLADAAQAKG